MSVFFLLQLLFLLLACWNTNIHGVSFWRKFEQTNSENEKDFFRNAEKPHLPLEEMRRSPWGFLLHRTQGCDLHTRNTQSWRSHVIGQEDATSAGQWLITGWQGRRECASTIYRLKSKVRSWLSLVWATELIYSSPQRSSSDLLW